MNEVLLQMMCTHCECVTMHRVTALVLRTGAADSDILDTTAQCLACYQYAPEQPVD